MGNDSSPLPNIKYGGFLDSSGTPGSNAFDDDKNNSYKKRRSSPPLTDSDLRRDANEKFGEIGDDLLESTDKSFQRRMQNLQNAPFLT